MANMQIKSNIIIRLFIVSNNYVFLMAMLALDICDVY